MIEPEKRLTALGEELKSRVEEVARRCGSLEYAAVVPTLGGKYFEFRIFTAKPKEGQLLTGDREVRVQLEVLPWKGVQKESLRRRQYLNGGL